MKTTITYRRHVGILIFDFDDGEWFGDLEMDEIGVISFGGKTIREAERQFEESVDLYNGSNIRGLI